MKMCFCTITKMSRKFAQAWENILNFTTGRGHTRDLNTGHLTKCIMIWGFQRHEGVARPRARARGFPRASFYLRIYGYI